MNLNDTFHHLKLSELVPSRTILNDGILHSVPKLGCQSLRGQH